MTSIRTATAADAKNLAELAETTFRDAFSGQNSSGDMEIYCRSNYSEAIQAEEISNPEYVTIVAENNNQLVAFAQLRWGKCPDCVAAMAPGEILRLYVDKAFHGQGLAHNVMSRCLEILGERHADIAWLGVWERNSRAIAFYRKFDFEEVGEHVFTLGKDAQRDVILVRPIGATTPTF